MFLPTNIALNSSSASTPIRICHNGSFASKGQVSLNSCMMTSSSGNRGLADILTTIRSQPFLAVGDLKKAYQQIFLGPVCRPYLKILHRRGGLGSGGEEQVLEARRLLFGICKADTVNQFGNDKEVKEQVIRNSYTDNLHLLGKTKEEVLNHIKVCQEGMELRGFPVKNNEWVVNFPLNSKADSNYNRSCEMMLLGIIYNSVEDSLEIKINFKLSARTRGEKANDRVLNSRESVRREVEKGLTKRDVLSLVHSCYDPLSLLLPVHSSLKVLYRDLLLASPGLLWDQRVPQEFDSRITALISQIVQLERVQVPRYIFQGFPEEEKRRLVLFADGGLFGSTVKVYVVSHKLNYRKELVSALLMCRHKLPNNQALQNAPKLEANALLMASRIAKKLKVELAIIIDEVLVATDSQLLINMIQGTSAAPGWGRWLRI